MIRFAKKLPNLKLLKNSGCYFRLLRIFSDKSFLQKWKTIYTAPQVASKSETELKRRFLVEYFITLSLFTFNCFMIGLLQFFRSNYNLKRYLDKLRAEKLLAVKKFEYQDKSQKLRAQLVANDEIITFSLEELKIDKWAFDENELLVKLSVNGDQMNLRFCSEDLSVEEKKQFLELFEKIAQN